MRAMIRVALVGLFCIAAAGSAVYWILMRDGRKARPANATSRLSRPTNPAVAESQPPPPVDTRTRRGGALLDQNSLDDSGVDWAHQFTGAIRDPNSLKELREAIGMRGPLGLSILKAELEQIHLNPETPKDRMAYAVRLERSVGLLQLYEGRFDEASVTFEKAQEHARSAAVPNSLQYELTALRGIVALRRGETDNCIACLGPSSCIFPIAPEAAHKQEAGSREAIEHLTRYLQDVPGDLRARWVLNIAYMTLGEYPTKVPPKEVIPLDVFRSKLDLGKFENVAGAAGLTTRGPNQAGGSVFDDFTGDGLPDVFTTSLDADLGASLYVNKGDGTFEERSDGLRDQVYVLNLARADYDNDGDLDLILLRGAWDVPMRLTLLRNRGDGRFDDVTKAAGMDRPISTEAATWGDYDNDGLIDLFICGELVPLGSDPATFKSDPRNRSRLYRNKGDGTFEDVADKVGLGDDGYAKGAAWGDYDGDGKLDLFVSNMNGPSRLYHQDATGKFKDVASELGVDHGIGFACWFWDFDNDGRLDIYVNGRGASLADTAAFALGITPDRPSFPHLYKNMGAEGFRDVAGEMGLHRVMTPMGCNFGDVDNDGYLDFYLGTGGMSFSHLVPNVFFKNVDGKRFEDITMSSGTGHLQKGHGVSFADYDNDGDLDFFVEAGGAAPGDRAYNLLFQNPGHKRHFLKIKLVGTKTNRAAIGARIKATILGADGQKRTIYRTVGNNSTFGGNSLAEHLGLGDATSVSELVVTWPSDGAAQTFRDVKGDRSIEITEGREALK